jgi:spermidine synthase
MQDNIKTSERFIFFITVFIAGLCSLVYELLISTTSSYFLGDSIKQFSLVIGIYMAAMGLGAYLTQFMNKNLLEWFVKVEILLGLVGGVSVPILYFVFDKVSGGEYQLIMLGLTFMIGVLTGFEIPLLVRILKEHYPLKSNLAYVLSLDYVGALIATLLFPFLLLPFVGTFRTSLIFGLINVFLGFFVYRFFTKELAVERKKTLEWSALACVAFFIGLGVFSGQLLKHWEDSFYSSQVVYSKQTPYQKLVLTKNQEALALYPLSVAPYKKNVLILGGGEGLLVREVLKFPEIESVTIVDLDEEVFRLGKENPHVRRINEGALSNPKVKLVANDAMQFLQSSNEFYDVILSDLPDPSNESVARLYSTAFYKLVQSKLSANGIFATQATSTFHTRNAFWCIYESLKASGFSNAYPYHVYVPSFGDWGFVMAANFPLETQETDFDVPAKFLDSTLLKKMFFFEQDIVNPGDIVPNRMDQPELLDYFLEDWEQWRKKAKN